MRLTPLIFISVGYPLMYWGANNIKHWNRSIKTTEAAPMALLFGVSTPEQLNKAGSLPIHPVPFPYESTSTGGTQPSSNSSGGTGGNSNGNSGGLSPNYPGGPNGTIPNPPIPGQPSGSNGGGWKPV